MSVTLKRRYKRRYILVLCSSSSEELLSITRNKAANMFGYILAQKAFLKLIDKIGPNLHVIHCRSEFLGEILSALTLIDNLRPATGFLRQYCYCRVLPSKRDRRGFLGGCMWNVMHRHGRSIR